MGIDCNVATFRQALQNVKPLARVAPPDEPEPDHSAIMRVAAGGIRAAHGRAYHLLYRTGDE